MGEKIRLDKFVSGQLQLSRTDAKKLIKSGSITVNGNTVNRPEQSIDTDNDEVCNDGSPVYFKKHIYIMLYKPKGVVSASDSPNDTTVVDIIPDSLKRRGLFPAGRLDKNTTGFVLVTDDGEFAHNILSPSHHVSKEYTVTASCPLTEDALVTFASGVTLSDGITKPAEIEFIGIDTLSHPMYKVILTEGRYHQIKRMFSSLGSEVIELKREAIGALRLDENLSEGECRELTDEELSLIRQKNI